ncbi:short-chain dehydrogenase [Thalassospira profundimaris]|uniref:Short-chain dehydrogenase n=1 Tax=Thalassospira profundimaris TaxID=502049 RepID=A0A367XIV0_9PROT|nr:oxidoreductase [Thalassospira profundimaris]RCK53593.1 short-chain dehydrogenase [Thalassospira profundimaris]
MTKHSPQKTFLITGVSSGFGRAFATAALNDGHTVIGTVRNETAQKAFADMHEKAHAILLDITQFDAIGPAIDAAQSNIGPIDVLVNNAGYGHEGILEESPLEELIAQFNANVFGAVAMIKAILPAMRQRRSGHIINITSMGGFITMPGISYYCGSKFALEGISETLASEVAPFGIHVTAIAPGSFRTDWAGRSMVRTRRSITDYDSLFDPIRDARNQKNGHQAGNPAKAAQALLHIIGLPNPPVHLLLGEDALDLVRTKMARLDDELSQWEDITRSTAFDIA